MSEKILSPMERAKLAKEKAEERLEASRYIFPKGNGSDKDNLGHHGKIFKCVDTTTEKKGTPVWEMHVTTKEVNPKGKRVDIKFNFWKSDKALDFLYSALELAGANLSSLPARQLDEAKHDELINKCMEKLEDDGAKIRFTCAHTERKGDPSSPNINYQKDGINVNFYLREFVKVDGKLPLEGVLDSVNTAPDIVAPTAKTVEAPIAMDSAFSDDD